MIKTRKFVTLKMFEIKRKPLEFNNGGVAQMVERSLSMREVPGSIPGASNIFITFLHFSN